MAPIRTFSVQSYSRWLFLETGGHRVGFSPSPGAKLGIFYTFPEQLIFPRAYACGIFIDGVWYFGTSEKFTPNIRSEAVSPVLGKSPQRRLCVGQALGLRSAWPSKTLPGQGPYAL